MVNEMRISHILSEVGYENRRVSRNKDLIGQEFKRRRDTWRPIGPELKKK